VIRKMVEMMLTGRTLDAATGERLGLSHYLVEPAKALEKAIELANAIAKNAQIPNYLIVQAIPRIGYVGGGRTVDGKRRPGGEHDLGRRPRRHRRVLRQAQDRVLRLGLMAYGGKQPLMQARPA
jgi:enoyl-CoA hydratase/carnithine racemase